MEKESVTQNEVQVIQFSPNGMVESLEHKHGVNIGVFGRKEIKRATLIEWDEGHQQWYIRFLLGKRANTLYKADGKVVYFDKYDDAKAVEIKVLNNDRRKGLEIW